MSSRVARLRLPRDTRERHSLVARLIGGAETVLDVGGVAGELQLFALGASVATANVEGPTDTLFDGSTLPFEDRSFHAVTSLDVIEHIPRSRRSRHLSELLRVARALVVVTTPLGTPGHIAAEQRLADWYASVVGREHRFLAEHIANGLPTEHELRELGERHRSADIAFRVAFAGDFRTSNATFANAVLARERRSPRALAAYALRHFAPLNSASLAREATAFSNRAFLIAYLGQLPARKRAQ